MGYSVVKLNIHKWVILLLYIGFFWSYSYKHRRQILSVVNSCWVYNCPFIYFWQLFYLMINRYFSYLMTIYIYRVFVLQLVFSDVVLRWVHFKLFSVLIETTTFVLSRVLPTHDFPSVYLSTFVRHRTNSSMYPRI